MRKTLEDLWFEAEYIAQISGRARTELKTITTWCYSSRPTNKEINSTLRTFLKKWRNEQTEVVRAFKEFNNSYNY